jgi:hypothetical protein
MDVRRIHTSNGSYIEPPLDQQWDALTKLRWQAGVVRADAGVTVYVMPGALTTPGLLGRPWVHWDYFALRIGQASHASYRYDEAWIFLNGVSAGAEATQREAAA